MCVKRDETSKGPHPPSSDFINKSSKIFRTCFSLPKLQKFH